MEKCPQCKEPVDDLLRRLIQDNCGHKKCRKCVVKDKFTCKQCCSNTDVNNITSLSNKTVENKSEEKKGSLVDDEQKRPYQYLKIPQHILTLAEKSYKCSICCKQFTTKSHIKYHSFCLEGKKPFSCDICNKEFITKYHYEVHLRTHTGFKPFTCSHCGKSFYQKSKLNRHSLLHSSLKHFMCQDCGKTFKTKDYLRTHSLIHQNNKLFSCKECDAKFNNSSNLKKHLISHKKDKNHMCDQCGKRFKFKTALTTHHKLHSQHRDYQCKQCAKAFFNLKDLQRHDLIHSDIKGYSCGKCMTKFRRKDNLERHIKNAHPGAQVSCVKNVTPTSIPVPVVTSIQSSKVINKVVTPPAAIEQPKKIQINAPLKLAFKTSAFKNCYNIHRDVEPINNTQDVDSVNIYQKILSPHNSGKIKSTEKEHQVNTITNPSILSSRFNLNDKPFDYNNHGSIKNIKFKVPAKYASCKTDNNVNSTKIPEQPETLNVPTQSVNTTSVIVKTLRKSD